MRNKQEITSIWVKLFPQFSGSSSTLQGRVREMMVHSILTGLVPAGAKVPPSRALAAALSLSRNTVSIALQVLVDKGFFWQIHAAASLSTKIFFWVKLTMLLRLHSHLLD